MRSYLSIIFALCLLCFFCGAAWTNEAPPPTGQRDVPTAPTPSPSTAPDARVNRREEDQALIPKPSLSRLVLYMLKCKDGSLREVPALVVRTWDHDPFMVNLIIFCDGLNDIDTVSLLGKNGEVDTEKEGALALLSSLIDWRTSVYYDQDSAENTWHWMPYQLGQAAKNDNEVKQLRNELAEFKESFSQVVAQLLNGASPAAIDNEHATKRMPDAPTVQSVDHKPNDMKKGLKVH